MSNYTKELIDNGLSELIKDLTNDEVDVLIIGLILEFVGRVHKHIFDSPTDYLKEVEKYIDQIKKDITTTFMLYYIER